VVRPLTRSGASLADIYDVVGSRILIDDIVTSELPIMHEMGQTVFSERFSMAVRREESGDIAQTISFNNIFTDLPAGPFRITNVYVFVDTASRITVASLALRSVVNDREVPFWTWDTSDDDQVRARLQDDGGAVATVTALVPVNAAQTNRLPIIAAGIGQPQRMEEIAFRGQSSTFGAGTVNCVALISVAFSQIAPGLSSRGLPIPSW